MAEFKETIEFWDKLKCDNIKSSTSKKLMTDAYLSYRSVNAICRRPSPHRSAANPRSQARKHLVRLKRSSPPRALRSGPVFDWFVPIARCLPKMPHLGINIPLGIINMADQLKVPNFLIRPSDGWYAWRCPSCSPPDSPTPKRQTPRSYSSSMRELAKALSAKSLRGASWTVLDVASHLE